MNVTEHNDKCIFLPGIETINPFGERTCILISGIMNFCSLFAIIARKVTNNTGNMFMITTHKQHY